MGVNFELTFFINLIIEHKINQSVMFFLKTIMRIEGQHDWSIMVGSESLVFNYIFFLLVFLAS